VAALAGTLNLAQIALLANAGTLSAFIAVALCVLVMRLRDPARPRPFRVPMAWIVAPFCIVGCAYLFGAGLSLTTQKLFLASNAIGLTVYFFYGVWRSRLAGQ
jgi:APA family basic amino acid/polyamine antiporter